MHSAISILHLVSIDIVRQHVALPRRRTHTHIRIVVGQHECNFSQVHLSGAHICTKLPRKVRLRNVLLPWKISVCSPVWLFLVVRGARTADYTKASPDDSAERMSA